MNLKPLTALVSTLVLASCSAGSNTQTTSSGNYPVTVQNCGTDVTFSAEPQRLVLLDSAAVPALHSLGVLDRAVARAGVFPTDYYDEATQNELSNIKTLTDEVDSTGHLQISKETVVSEQPDLVLGESENLTRDSLASLSIPVIDEPTYCKTGAPETASFEDVYSQLSVYGKIFDRTEQADQAVTDLKERVAAAEDQASGEGRTIAFLYPTVGGGTTYAYGVKSMATPQAEAAGFENVFADVDDRVFEITPEELIKRNPDVIVALYTAGDSAEVVDAVRSLPGAETLTAVKNNQVEAQLLNFTEPASALSVTGLEMLNERF